MYLGMLSILSIFITLYKVTFDSIKNNKVIYISCNPATLVRDLSYLEEIYEIKEIQPVDMFPFTSHVECVAVMCLK